METKPKVNVEPNNSLMKKTKAQLVEIILRKDDVEKSIRKDFENIVSNLTKKNNDLRDNYNTLKVNYNKLDKDNNILVKEVEDKNALIAHLTEKIQNNRADFEESVDELASERQNLLDKVTRYKCLFYLTIVIFIITVLTMIL